MVIEGISHQWQKRGKVKMYRQIVWAIDEVKMEKALPLLHPWETQILRITMVKLQKVPNQIRANLAKANIHLLNIILFRRNWLPQAEEVIFLMRIRLIKKLRNQIKQIKAKSRNTSKRNLLKTWNLKWLNRLRSTNLKF